jgi:NADH dehydrogenase
MGGWVAADIVANLQGEPHKSFSWFDFGSMAVLGPLHAVADIRGLRVSGALGWLLWGLAHLAFMPATENRISLLSKWLWAIATRERASMLITGHPNQHLAVDVGLDPIESPPAEASQSPETTESPAVIPG